MPAHPRPLSPHLGIYRWRVNMVQSSLHRVTGLLLSLCALFITWGVIAAASSNAAWRVFAAFSGSGFGIVLWLLWIWAMFFHLCNGIQHLFHSVALDYGPQHIRDRTRPPSYWKTGWIVVSASSMLTLLTWILVVVRMAGGAT